MITIKQSIHAISVILLVLTAVFICALFSLYNANLSFAREIAESQADNVQLLAQIDGKASMGRMILILSGISMGVTAIVALIMHISRHIAENQASMGVLKAMGYRNGQIAGSYALFGVPVLIGSILGFIIALLLEPGFGSLLNSNVDLPKIERQFPWLILSLFIPLPTIIFTLFSILIARIKLCRSPLAMIRDNVSAKTGILARRASKRKTDRPFLKELSSTVVRCNLVLLFFVVFAGLAFGNQLQLGFAVFQMTDKTLDRALEGVGYTSNVRFMQFKDGEQKNGEVPYKTIYGKISFGEDSLTHGELVAFQSGSDVFKLLDVDTKQEIHLNDLDGVVVNDWLRHKYDLSIGDAVQFEQNGKIFALPIAAFERSPYGETIYCGNDFALKYGVMIENGYNGLYTTEAISFDSQKHVFVSTAQDIRIEFQKQKETYQMLSLLFFVLGTMIGVITLQIALRAVINANRKYIAMMKAYGYTKVECNQAILSKYRPVAYVGFIIGTGYAYGILTVLFGMTAKTSNMLVPVTVDIWSVLVAPLLFIAAYEMMIAAFGRKISAVSLKEIMSD